MPRLITAAGFVLLLAFSACSKPNSPEAVADAFVDAYFGRMDQEKAKEFTAFGATAMLEAELREVSQLRKDGYTPGEAAANVTMQRGEATKRDQRIRVPYEIIIRAEGVETFRDADIELTQIDGQWKVVRVGLRSR